MKLVQLFAIAGIVAFSGYAVASASAASSVTVQMKALNGSNETGTAVVTQAADGLKVVVTLKNAPAGTPQPMHIHVGTCAKINAAPEYPLASVVDGKSTSVVKGVKLADLLAAQYAINVHKSAKDIATYVSCGDILAK